MLVHSFSAMVSPTPPPPIPVSLGILIPKPAAEKLPEIQIQGFSARVPCGHLLPLAFLSPFPLFSGSFPSSNPTRRHYPVPAGPLRARRPTPQLFPWASFSPGSSLFPCVFFTCSRAALHIRCLIRLWGVKGAPRCVP